MKRLLTAIIAYPIRPLLTRKETPTEACGSRHPGQLDAAWPSLKGFLEGYTVTFAFASVSSAICTCESLRPGIGFARVFT